MARSYYGFHGGYTNVFNYSLPLRSKSVYMKWTDTQTHSWIHSFFPPNCMYLCSLKAWKLAWNLEIVCAYIIILTFSEILFIYDYINIGLRRQIVQILHYKLHRVVRVMFLLSLFWVFPRAPQPFHCHLHWPIPLSLFCSSKRLDLCSFNKYYLRSFRCQALFWA